MTEHDNPEIAEESIELSDADQKDLAQLFSEPDGGPEAEAPQFHTVLEVWREVLRPAREEGLKKVTPQWAARMVAKYTELRFCDCDQLRDYYFGKIDQLFGVLLEEIEGDDDCLSYGSPEEDAAENAHHYKNLLLSWQLALLQWELDWQTTSDDAAIELAAIAEVHTLFFQEGMGLTAFLDNIKFEYTEADQRELAAALNELRGTSE